MKMNTITPILVLMLCSNFAWSQQQIPDRTETLDVEDIRIRVSNGANFLSDNGIGGSAIQFEKSDQLFSALLYTSALWIGAEDESGTLHLGAMTYRQRGHDFYPGPISDDSINTASRYNDIYRVTQQEIKKHISDPGSVQAVNNWPGNGNTAIGEPKIIAPFVDLNNNDIYEPQDGEYPKIRGDVSFFSIFNDNGVHGETGGVPLKVDIRMMVYAFYAPSEFENQVFTHYSIENRSNNDYSNAYFGIFNDYDLGNYNDDYVGTDSLNSMIFTYNQDNNDEGISGFGLNPPAFGMKWLSHQMNVGKMYINSTDQVNGNPTKPADYYNYLRGLNKDGSAIRDDNNQLTSYEYYGEVTNPNEWHEHSLDAKVSDKRAVSSVGPSNFGKGDVQCFDIVYVYARKSNLTTAHLVNVDELKETAIATQYEYNQRNIQDDFSLCQDKFNTTENFKLTKVECYPNPSTDVVNIDLQEYVNKVTSILVIDALGNQFTVQSTNNNHIQIPSLHLAKGVYQIVITTDQRRIVSRFVKQ